MDQVNEDKNLGGAVVDRETVQGLTTKYERAELANKMLIAIASCGRRFFAHEDRVSQFTIDQRGRIWFIDKYTQKRIYVQYEGRWRGFSDGGTLHALVERLRDFIARGTLLPAGIFGPWPEWVCGGDLWGYGNDMQSVRDAALRLGITNRTVSQSQTKPAHGPASGTND